LEVTGVMKELRSQEARVRTANAVKGKNAFFIDNLLFVCYMMKNLRDLLYEGPIINIP